MRAMIWSLVLAAPAFLAGSGAYADALPNDGIRVLLRGPIHEAFAQPFNMTPLPGPVAPKQPPETIIEIPPDERPAGDNVVWIPGYWSWDSDTANFIWVSGFWRVPPPGRTWTPGYWTPVAGGWQWVSGYWAVNGQPAVLLAATPPASLETGPAGTAPDAASMYVPGYWFWNQNRYAWRPGCWTPGQADWVWIPAQYHWTPAGCNFVDGYWDYPPERRGMLLAPVAFERPVFAAPGWRYRPAYAVNLAGLCGSLFIRPACSSYYFGDYYGPDCLRAGFQPWCVYGPRCYDPLFTYGRWMHRDFPAWQTRLVGLYEGRLKGDIPRPPRTLALQDRLVTEQGGNLRVLHNTSDIVRNETFGREVPLEHMLTPLGQIKRVEGRDMSFVKVSPAERDRIAEATKEFRKIVDTRRVAEKPAAEVRRTEPHIDDHRTSGGIHIQTGPQVRISNAPPNVNISAAQGNVPAVHPTAQPNVTRSTPTPTATPPAHTASPAQPATPAHSAAPVHTPPPSPPMHTSPPAMHTSPPAAKPSSSSTPKAAPRQTSTPKETSRSARTTPAHTTTSRTTRSSQRSAPARNSGNRSSSGGRSSSGNSSSGRSGKK